MVNDTTRDVKAAKSLYGVDGTEKTPTGLGAVFHVHIDANGSQAPSVIAT
jgi:hypothetical protein